MQAATRIKTKSAAWAQCLKAPSRYKTLWGGRGGGKTCEIAQELVIRGISGNLIVACCRQFQNSIEESVKPELVAAIDRCGLHDYYVVQDREILGVYPGTKIPNGTRFFFKGLERNVMSIKGWANVDIVWVEEANTLKADALELLKPTIRKAGSEIWFSLNRHSRADPVDKMFLQGKAPPNAIVVKVGWQDNPFVSKELNDERLNDLKNMPERYKHVWEGEPDDDVNGYVLLQMGKLLQCVDAHKKLGYKPHGRRHGGFDVADSMSGDNNSFVLRQGSLVYDVIRWRAQFMHMSADKVNLIARDEGLSRLYYDATGVGAGIKSDFSRIGNKPYSVKPFRFGDAVKGPETTWIKTGQKPVYNKDAFVRQNAQAAWNLRMRVDKTIRALNGEDVDLDRCFFVAGNIPDLEAYLLELSQPVWDTDMSDRIKIDKAPDDKPSPDMYDGTAMAFAYDIKNGLRSER